MKDWAFTTTVEEMEAATNSLLENAQKVGADTWQQRVKNQTPHCGFGESTAIGSRPTAVRTEKRPPTSSGTTKVS